MSNEIKPKKPNIRLKDGATPITISGRAHTGGKADAMRFPTEVRQKNGWQSQEAKRIVKEYPDRYELIKPDGNKIEGGN